MLRPAKAPAVFISAGAARNFRSGRASSLATALRVSFFWPLGFFGFFSLSDTLSGKLTFG